LIGCVLKPITVGSLATLSVQSRGKDHSFTNRLGGYYMTRLRIGEP